MNAVVDHVARMAVGSVCLLGAMVLAARLFEVTFPVEPDRPRKQVWFDYKIVAVCLLVPCALSSITALTSRALIATCGGGLIHLRSDGWWLLPSLLTYLIAYDFYRYWSHRIQHIVPWLWSIHSLHHSAENLSFIQGSRHHWLDTVLNTGFFTFFPIVFQVPPDIILAGSIIIFLPDSCAHVNVRLSLGRYGLWINNPQYHRIHHSSDPKHFDKNFAAVFPFWDVVFGTVWRPAPDEFPSTGLPDGDRPRSVWDGMVWPFRRLPVFAAKPRELVSEQPESTVALL